MRFVGFGFVALIAASSCSAVEPYQSKETAESFSPYDWNDRKQAFLRNSRARVNQIADELSSIGDERQKRKRVDEAKAALDDAKEELKQLKYSGVREWSSEKDDFISTMNDLEEKYEKARRL